MRRILHLRTVTGHGGGPEKTLLNSQRFIGEGYELRLLYIRPANDPNYNMPRRACELGVSLLDVPERGPADLRTVWRVAREIRRFRPDLLHPHDYKTNLISIPLARLFGMPVITTMHGYVTLGGRLNWYYRLDRWALRRMNHVIAVSSDLVAVMESLGLPAERYTVLDNGIDCEGFRRTIDAASAKRRWRIAADRLVLGAVGRLAEEKGFDVLLEAAAELLSRGYGLDVLIAGEGPERANLEQLANRLGCSDRVHFLGHQADVRAVYEAMDVFLLTSRREGLPNSLLEACAMSLPCVASDVAGVPRVVAHGVNGFLVKSPSAQAFAAALEPLLNDADSRHQMGVAARQTVEERFSFAARMAKVRAIYDRVLGGKRVCGQVVEGAAGRT